MFGNVCRKPRTLGDQFMLLGMLFVSCAASSFASAATMFCELASLPMLPLAADSSESLSPNELLTRVAESYRGLLEFGGEEFASRLEALVGANSADAEFASPEKFFGPVPGRDQRSVALHESLAKLGDWVLLDADAHGLTQEMILVRLREVVRAYLGQAQEEQERLEETREERRDLGRETETGHVFKRDYRFPDLGEAWRDPSGMVWGDSARDRHGYILRMNHADALKYCLEIGAELPSGDDFIRLREYMGAQSGTHEGYRPQILPGLRSREWFWSSWVSPDPKLASSLNSLNGGIQPYDPDHYSFSVRCVRR